MRNLPTYLLLSALFSADLPLFNQDLEATGPTGLPAAVRDFQQRIEKADCFVFACCEYNYSISGAMKNAIDWGSRPTNHYNDKPGAIVCAGGGDAGLRAEQHLRDIAVFINVHFMNNPSMRMKIFTNPSPFDMQTGDLVDPEAIQRAKVVTESLVSWTTRLTGKK